MNTTLIKISKVAFDLLFWVGILALVGLALGAVFLPAIAEAAGDGGESFTGSFLGATIELDLAELDVSDATQFGWAALLAGGSGVAVGVYVAHQVRRALRSVLRETAFRQENYGRLRRIAYAVFALVPFGIVSQSWMDSITHGSFQLSLDLQLGTVAIGLLALSVAEIYRAGITLQDEAELTV